MAGGTGIGVTYSTYKERTTAPSTPAATYDRLYFTSAGPYYVNSAGTASQLATTTGTLHPLLDEDAEITAEATLTANQCSGGLISNYNQSVNCTVTVPTAFAGGNFIVALSTAVAKYYRLDPTGSEIFVWDGVAQGAGKYIGIANATVGAALQFIAVQTGAAAWTWHVYTVAGAWSVEG